MNSGRSYLITAVPRQARDLHIDERAKILAFYFEVSLFIKKQICKTLVTYDDFLSFQESGWINFFITILALFNFHDVRNRNIFRSFKYVVQKIDIPEASYGHTKH